MRVRVSGVAESCRLGPSETYQWEVTGLTLARRRDRDMTASIAHLKGHAWPE
jgi:hypothetical protein